MKSYDYIVVGAGTAGCVLAARLSEDGDAQVLLLEAGSGQSPAAVAVPSAWPALRGTSMDWADETVTQTATGRVVPWARGRGLGGSSAVNGMVFLRGHRTCYDAWASAGADGWGFDDLLPFFRRSENAEGRDPAVRGLGGPLNVAPAARGHPLAAACLDAAEEAGYPKAADLGSGLEEGAGWCDLNIVDGKRQSAADAYLRPASGRANLEVVTDALAHRVTLDGERCTGVEYSVGTRAHTARCSGEVVLAAGAIGSPQLLMLSGIGPPAQLRENGIGPALALPGVGANLHDHPMSGIVYRAAGPVPAAANNHAEAQILLRGDAGLDAPDLQMMVVDLPLREETLPGPGAGEGYTVVVSLMAPYSRGRVMLAGAAPGTAPVIDPEYYTDSRDLDRMTVGLRLAREIGRTTALDPWRGEEVLPGRAVQDEEPLRDYLRRNLRSYHHPGGTCGIGEDETAVVDARLRVRGLSGLRVADASVMPSPVSANSNATVYGIAERAAELLRS
ncbi:GMC family oxidoreductase [Streptomyces sp. AK02-01A]|uniref:GMC family oxidoreductase n=1 Tax=Streptomyces sp. AK02-01A TaxID=3028648 RepID=UPI0029BEF303|nr:GMC family oxidoreductase N-terminal domain-containing protein [Streptomyces sp. AK02-01A]MDX3851324.1 GMC family oxidoreductase N-terminal domain-containing protein [Streptomyces sp. AK02-01A]